MTELGFAIARSLLLACVIALAATGSAANSGLSAEEVSERWHERLAGRQFTATVVVRSELDGRTWNNEFTLWRDDKDGARERLVVHYEKPDDLRGTMLLYLENRGRPTDYFVYQPRTRRVRRTSESVIRSNAQGMDMEYLGFGLAPTEPTEIEGVEEEVLNGRPSYRLRETSTLPDARFAHRTIWVDAETFIPMKVEHEKGGQKTFEGRVEKVEAMAGVSTPVEFSASYPTAGRRVSARITSVDYESEIPDTFFSTLRLIRPR